MIKHAGQGFSRRVTSKSLEVFAPLLRLGHAASDSSEADSSDEANNTPVEDSALLEAQGLFRGTHFKSKIPFHYSRSSPAVAKKPVIFHTRATKKGALVWQKVLPASDVQRQPGNPTGGVRLTQARWYDEGKRIDWTTYFRNKVFAGLEWRQTRARPFVEEAVVRFDVTVLGKRLGIHELAVSHKPSGEAGQANYTTILQWTGLSQTIKDADLTGRTLRLYAPPAGAKEPFFIEIL